MTLAIGQAFCLGRHTVRVTEVREGQWIFTIDDGNASETFQTASAAWAAGIRAAFIRHAWARIKGFA
jgi:hypothetical protein